MSDKYEYIPKTNCVAFFHGEEWYKCPHCQTAFEIHDTDFENNGIKKTEEKGVYVCGNCGKKYRIV